MTLLEVVVALAVVGIALFGVLTTLVNCMLLDSMTRQRSTAINAALKRMEEIRGVDFSQVADLDNRRFYVAELARSSTDSGGLVTVDDANEDLLEVTVSVSWLDFRNRTQEFNLTSMITSTLDETSE